MCNMDYKTSSTAKEEQELDIANSESEERKRRIAKASRLSRAKKKEEFILLKTDNARLKQETDALKAKIKQLQSQIDNNLSNSELNVIAENSALQIQLSKHREFVKSFLLLTSGAPSTKSVRESLCRQGAEAAQAYVQALISQSQSTWRLLNPPRSMKKKLKDVLVHYQLLGSGLLKENEGADVCQNKAKQRLNLRIDLSLPNITKSKISDIFWELFRSVETQKLYFGVEALALKKFDGPDPDTEILYQKNKENKSVVFICNRRTSELAKSTLSEPPTAPSSSGDLLGKRKPSSFGSVEATVCAMTSTRSTIETMHSLEESIEEGNVTKIKSVVIQGSAAYEDDTSNTTRFVAVLSYPEDYRIIDVSHSDCFQNADTMSETFGKLLMGVVFQLTAKLYSKDVEGTQGLI